MLTKPIRQFLFRATVVLTVPVVLFLLALLWVLAQGNNGEA